MVGFSISIGPLTFMVSTDILSDVTYPAVIFWFLTLLAGTTYQPILSQLGISLVFVSFSLFDLFGLLSMRKHLIETGDITKKQIIEHYKQQSKPIAIELTEILDKKLLFDRQ